MKIINMTRNDLANLAASELDIPVTDSKKCLNTFLKILCVGIRERGGAELRGFGTFKVVQRKARVGRNPNAPAANVEIPARKVVKFKMAKELKKAIQ